MLQTAVVQASVERFRVGGTYSQVAVDVIFEPRAVYAVGGAVDGHISCRLRTFSDAASYPPNQVYLGKLLGVARCLERMADHCTNIAEDLIYMMQGKIIRHHDVL